MRSCCQSHDKPQKDKWKEKWGDARGSKGKGMVIGLRERETGKRVYVAFDPYMVPKQPVVEKIIAKYVEPGATIYTDDASFIKTFAILAMRVTPSTSLRLPSGLRLLVAIQIQLSRIGLFRFHSAYLAF